MQVGRKLRVAALPTFLRIRAGLRITTMPQAAITLESPVTALFGVGAERAAQLARLRILTLRDLLWHRPRRYEDRRHLAPIAALRLGEAATTRGRVVAAGTSYYRKRTKSVFEIILDDGTARLHCRWWNLPFLEKYFKVGDDVMVFGRPNSLKPRTIDHPETENVEEGEEVSIHMDRIAPVYPLTEGLPQRVLRSLVWRALSFCAEQIAEPWPDLNFEGLPSRREAVRALHFPAEMVLAKSARERLALEEFIELQLAIQRRRRNLQAKARGLPAAGDNHLIRPFLHGLGFALTGAQTRVLRDIRQDMGGEFPMRRLIQGDVGSGKTVVAACTALMALESNLNVALMAPTEILAEQHHANFARWLRPLGVAVELQTGSRKTLNRAPGAAQLSMNRSLTLPSPPEVERVPEGRVRGNQGDSRSRFENQKPWNPPTLVVGTHALIADAFALDRLGLVIIDEQHKFGVAQRETLVRKGRYPHLLVMTATPIPRTLGLTLYGDLDISVIDEMPAGRAVTRTFVRTADKLAKVWEFLRDKLAGGRQAYIVYPRVEESTAGVKAVTQEFDRLAQTLAPFKVGLLHGRLSGEAKEAVMAAFRRNELQVLLATSVIEVGVDVPNATVMIIENAEQFGLAQLHQLRGRIGRGAHESFCILIAAAKTDEAQERLRVLEETSDGFRIAEADLQLRGPGELVGQAQSGLPDFRFGNLAEDLRLVERARDLAAELLRRESATRQG